MNQNQFSLPLCIRLFLFGLIYILLKGGLYAQTDTLPQDTLWLNLLHQPYQKKLAQLYRITEVQGDRVYYKDFFLSNNNLAETGYFLLNDTSQRVGKHSQYHETGGK